MLATESKKRIEESNQERDRVMLKEQQYLRQIARLEERIKSEGQDRQERSDRIIESLRQKQKTLLENKEDEISDLRIKFADARDLAEKNQNEKDSLRREVEKLYDQVRGLKEESASKFDQYSKSLNRSETENEEKARNLVKENERLKDENSHQKRNLKETSDQNHTLTLKLDGYMKDYQRYFEENSKLRELLNVTREEKDAAISETRRLKMHLQERI